MTLLPAACGEKNSVTSSSKKVAGLRRHVAFYVGEYNATIPHAAFAGQTPDEVYLGRGAEIPGQLEVARRAAQARRLATNRALSCPACSQQGVAA
jgi:hypothetical protein